MQLFHDLFEHARWNRQVEKGAFRTAKSRSQRFETIQRCEVNLHVPQSGKQSIQYGFINVSAETRNAVAGALSQLFVGEVLSSQPDDGRAQHFTPLHGIERAENLAVREISGGTKEHESVGWRSPVHAPSFFS
jgi:hypothetical protein